MRSLLPQGAIEACLSAAFFCDATKADWCDDALRLLLWGNDAHILHSRRQCFSDAGVRCRGYLSSSNELSAVLTYAKWLRNEMRKIVCNLLLESMRCCYFLMSTLLQYALFRCTLIYANCLAYKRLAAI